jgi:hypothetical protein
LPQPPAPVSYVHVAEFGAVLLPVEFENSSLHTSVPGAIFVVKLRLVTVLTASPATSPMASTVISEVTRNGARYRMDLAVGMLPSMV